MDLNLTPVASQMKTFAQYWDERKNPGAETAWEESQRETLGAYQVELLLIDLDWATKRIISSAMIGMVLGEVAITMALKMRERHKLDPIVRDLGVLDLDFD
jgi:hypothetical protein